MASKFCLVLLLASSLAFLLVADATFIRTTVSEVEEENRSRFGGESCSSEKLMEKGFSNCMTCLKQSHGGGRYGIGRPIRGSECEDVCCNMMESMGGRRCMCQGLKSMVSECEESPSSYGEMMCRPMMMMKHTMMEIPTMCGQSECNYHMILV